MLKKILWLLLAVAIALALAITSVLYRPPPPPSQAFLNAVVLTMNPNDDVAEAVLVEGDRIVAVGSDEEIRARADDNTVIHDLSGHTLIPGFIDAHGHFPGSGLTTKAVDLNSPPIGEIDNIAEAIEALRLKADVTPAGKWIYGVSYDDTLLAEKRHLTRHDLDRVSTRHPILASHISGHLFVANSLALESAGIDRETPDPVGGVIRRDSQGEPNGVLEEEAGKKLQVAAMEFSALDLIAVIEFAAAQYAAVGVTTAQSGLTPGLLIKGLYYLEKFNRIPFRLEIWSEHHLGLEVAAGTTDFEKYQSDTFAVGAIKVVADGSIQAYTGYLRDPYHVPFEGDADYRGYPRTPRDELAEIIAKLHSADLHIAIHGNGDAAIDDILYAVREAQKAHPREDPRHILIHSQMARPDQLDEMLALGITPSFFVAHTYYWGDRHRDIFMGPERAARMSPLATAEAKKLRYSIHLDTPVVPMNPLLLVWSAVNRLSISGAVIGPAERVSPIAALRATTIDAAWQIFQEGNRGSIEVGKFADLVVLSENPTRIPERIRDIEVEWTLVAGRTIYRNPTAP